MNWFERYGIVGMFFVVMTGIWYSFLFPYSVQQFFELPLFPKLIFGIGGLAVLPCGYLITIFQKQMFYWRRPSFIEKLLPLRIHKKMWEGMTSNNQEYIKNKEKEGFLKDIDKNILEDEVKIEYVLAFYSRIKYFAEGHVADFIRKRFDVISINHGFIWVVILSPLMAILLKVFLVLGDVRGEFFSRFESFLVSFRFSKVLVLLILSIVIIVLLKCSMDTYAKQMINVFARKMSWPKEEEKKNSGKIKP